MNLNPAFHPWRRGFFFLLSANGGGAVATDWHSSF
jgi:hypothetical protein